MAEISAIARSNTVQLSSDDVKPVEYHKINVRYLMVEAALRIDEAQQNKIQVKHEELSDIKDRLSTITTFIEKLSGGLANREAKEVNLANESALVERINAMSPNKLTQKTVWTRAEAETLLTMLTRRSDKLQSESHDLAVKINRCFEDWHELTPLWKDLMKKLDDHIDRIINRRPN